MPASPACLIEVPVELWSPRISGNLGEDKAPLFQMKSPAEAGLFLSECSSWISVRSVLELRHRLELILGSREDGVVRIPSAVSRIARSPVVRCPIA